MPQKTLSIPTGSIPLEQKMPIAYAAARQLQWNVKYADEERIIAYTPRSWKKWDHEIIVEFQHGELTVTSKMIHGEAFDLGGKNRKYTEEFANTFHQVSATVDEIKLAEWQSQMYQNTEKTIQQSIELQNALNPNDGNMYGSFGIMAINVLVFVAMIVSGVNIIEPTGEDILKWGGNFGPITTNGEPWRLLTSVFVHIGIIHLLFNTYALYIVASYLEPMLGKLRFFSAYLCTGVLASIASLWWHSSDPTVSAGASGAIFGLFGVILALLSTSLIPKQARASLLQGIGIFVGYNLLYGLGKDGVDNAAHIGGLISGLIIGYFYYFQLRKKETEETTKSPASRFMLPAVIILITVAALWFTQTKNFESIERDDSKSFSMAWTKFAAMEAEAIAAMSPSDTSSQEFFTNQLKEKALKNWEESVILWKDMENNELSEKQRQLRGLLQNYCEERVVETKILLKMYEEDSDEYYSEFETQGQKVSKAMKNIEEALENE